MKTLKMLSIEYWRFSTLFYRHIEHCIPNIMCAHELSIMHDYAVVRDKISWFHNITTYGFCAKNHFRKDFSFSFIFAMIRRVYQVLYHEYHAYFWVTWSDPHTHLHVFFLGFKRNAAVVVRFESSNNFTLA